MDTTGTRVNGFILLFIVIGCIPSAVCGQDSLVRDKVFRRGISLDAGIGFLRVVDEGISNERYTGAMPQLGISWYESGEGFHSGKDFTLFSGGNIRNYNVSAAIINFYYRGYRFYPLLDFSVFSKPARFLLGYNDNFFLHYRSQNIASGGFAAYNAYSIYFLFSLGPSIACQYQLHPGLQLTGTFHLGALALGGSSFVDPDKYDASSFKVLTVFNGLDGSVRMALRYRIHQRVSACIGYRIYINRITAWGHFFSTTHDAFLAIQWHY